MELSFPNKPIWNVSYIWRHVYSRTKINSEYYKSITDPEPRGITVPVSSDIVKKIDEKRRKHEHSE